MYIRPCDLNATSALLHRKVYRSFQRNSVFMMFSRKEKKKRNTKSQRKKKATLSVVSLTDVSGCLGWPEPEPAGDVGMCRWGSPSARAMCKERVGQEQVWGFLCCCERKVLSPSENRHNTPVALPYSPDTGRRFAQPRSLPDVGCPRVWSP